MSQLSNLVEKARVFPDLFNLSGRRALVVGGNKGLGQAMSLALAASGARVCVAGRSLPDLEETVAAVNSVGNGGLHVACDVTSEENVRDLVAQAVDAMGGIDILVNSQGAVHLETAECFDMEQWERIITLNLKSLVMTCKHAGRDMLKRGKGKIVNISSVRSFQGRKGDLAYSPSKGGVNQLTRSLAIEWGPKGVNVNAIAPSFIRTELNEDFLDDPQSGSWVLSRSPMGRVGALDDMFGAVVYLASDASNFVNGHVLLVDGGWTIA